MARIVYLDCYSLKGTLDGHCDDIYIFLFLCSLYPDCRVLLKHNLKFSKCDTGIAHIKGSEALLVVLDCYSLKGILEVHHGEFFFPHHLYLGSDVLLQHNLKQGYFL